MEAYMIMLLFIIICAALDNIVKGDFFKIIVFVGLALFAGLRNKVGIDYESYVSYFYDYYGFRFKEPGGYLMILLSRYLRGTEHLYFLLMAVITEFFAYKTLIRYDKKNFWFITMVFYCVSLFYLASFNASRQYMAITVCIWSLHYIGKSPIRYFLTIAISAFFFHISCAIFIPLYFVLNKKFTKSQILIGAILILLSGRFLYAIIELTPYAKYEELTASDMRENVVHLTQYVFAALTLAMVYFGDKLILIKNNPMLRNLNALCLYTIILVIIQPMGSMVMLFQRINNYFFFSYLIIIPAIVMSLKPANRNIFRTGIIALSLAYFAMTIIVNGKKHMLVPYDMSLNIFNF